MADYYVRPTNGDDLNAGTSFAAAFQTTQKLLDTATAGDNGYLIAEATETVAAQIDDDTNSGTAAAPITIQGRNSDDTADARYTIQLTSAADDVLNTDPAIDYKIYRNITFDANGNGQQAVGTATFDSTWFGPRFESCRFTGAIGDGTEMRSRGASFYDCEFDNNGGWGAGGTFSAYDMVVGCRFHNNGSGNLKSINTAGGMIVGCEFYKGGGDDLHLNLTSANETFVLIAGNTFHDAGTTDACIFVTNSDATSGLSIVNNTFNGRAYGIEADTGVDLGMAYIDHNHFDGQATGETNLAATPGDNNQSGDPLFASVADGSEDFTPDDGSPLDGNGLLGVDIGARKAADPAGGDPFPSQGIQAIGAGVAA